MLPDVPATFDAALTEAARRSESCLNTILPADGQSRLGDAMRYGVLNGGKRLRAFLVIEGARLFRVPEIQADRAAAAIECLHAYSLIHDDLPAMDDDDLRRGVPTVHKAWDEATAILAGDALQTLAFETLAHTRTAPDPTIRVKLIAALAEAAGADGMVGGQDMDLAAEAAKTPLSLDDISELQDKKTGALIRWAAKAGAILGKSDTAPLGHFATNIGLAFQIQDDILDVTGDAKIAGKRLRKDKNAGKATFVSHLGLGTARDMAAALVEEAVSALSPYGSDADHLRDCARYIISREK